MNKHNILRISCLLVIVILITIGFYHPIYWISIALVILIYVSVIFFMSMNMGYNFFLKATHRMPSDHVMLTFDDGPHPIYTVQILDILKRHNIKAMFFLIGKNVIQYPEIVNRIVAENHIVGGHTMNHQKSFGWMSLKKVKSEIMDGLTAIESVIGQPTVYFRPPFGVTNPKIAQVSETFDLKVIGWSARSFDTAFKDADKLQNRLINQIEPSNIVLLHDSMAVTVEVLENVIILKKKEGVVFDVLPEMKNI